MTKREELLKRAEDVWNNPTYDDLLDLVSELVKYIKERDNND